MSNTPSLPDRFLGCLLGAAVGDALGAPVENLTPPGIEALYGGPIAGIVPPRQTRHDPRHKGDGVVTDDTLMTAALCRAYLAKGGQLEAHDMATHFMKQFAETDTWVPELGRTMLLMERAHYPEKYIYLRLRLLGVSPREGGVGNMVNCGAAMYAAPVGLMNGCDPDEAYRRAIDLFSAHQHSYGLEAAGVMAACVARAMVPGATARDVVDTALRLAKDGTRAAIAAVIEAAATAGAPEGRATQAALRTAIEPFDGRGGTFDIYNRAAAMPSQRHAIEELPIALGYVALGRGDLPRTLLAAANYGR
ncbi:MAG: ADP-ribosylglycohydrolase family protein, partial [Alphaproteobacteria bacterium]|nr:ADP-ribosylglycohydrolase family protein [Alphaproteobacteria bacterium]